MALSAVAGCNNVANLGDFDNAHLGSTDAAVESGTDAASRPDAELFDAAIEDSGTVPAEASVDATTEDALVAEDSGVDATVADSGFEAGEEAEAGPAIDAGEDAETDAAPACTCSAYGTTTAPSCDVPCAPVCGAYFGDCNASSAPNPDDGCETYLDSLASCRASCGGTATACGATDVCNAGICGAAQGLTVFTVPLSAVSQIQRYADRPAVPWNLEGKTLFVRAYAPGATGGQLYVYLSDASANSNVGPGVMVQLSQLAGGWIDITLPNITDQPSPFSAEQVKQVTIEVQAGGTATTWTSPTVVYIDSVRSSDVTIDDTFDTSFGNMVSSSLEMVAGSTLTWQDAVSSPSPSDGGAADGGATDAGDAGASDAGTGDGAADGG